MLEITHRHNSTSYLRILAVPELLTFTEVSLISDHLVVDLVVDLEELGGDVPVLDDAHQLHDPPLHLLTGPADLRQKCDVLRVSLARYDLRQ